VTIAIARNEASARSRCYGLLARTAATTAPAWPWPIPCSDFNHATVCMCFSSLYNAEPAELTVAFESLTGQQPLVDDERSFRSVEGFPR